MVRIPQRPPSKNLRFFEGFFVFGQGQKFSSFFKLLLRTKIYSKPKALVYSLHLL